MRRILVLTPLAVLAALALAFAILLTSERQTNTIPSPLIGQAVPQIDLPPLTGLEDVGGLSGADFVGEVTIVNFFASWCLPCLAEHPLITALAADGHTVFGIDYRDPEPDGLEWLNLHGNPYARIGADFDARAGLDWGVTGVPETFIIDAAGVIRHKHSGPLTTEIIEREILPVIRSLEP